MCKLIYTFAQIYFQNKLSFDLFSVAGAHEEIDYSAKLKFSDDEGDEEGEEEKAEGNNDLRCVI